MRMSIDSAPFIDLLRRQSFFHCAAIFSFVKGQLTIFMQIHFWIFYSVPLICVSILSSVPHCFEEILLLKLIGGSSFYLSVMYIFLQNNCVLVEPVAVLLNVVLMS